MFCILEEGPDFETVHLGAGNRPDVRAVE